MTSPVIERAVVRRGSDIVEPEQNLLQTLDQRNLEGAVMKTREGSVVFPIDVFSPESAPETRIIIIPVAGKNFDVKLRSYALEGAFERGK
jgi:hypothetical protein